MPNLVLGVSGSVAAYRAADLARDLMRAGFTVRVCLTDGAKGFVQPALFEALTGQPCLDSVFDEPEPGRMAHIDWARQAEVLLVAPATASTLSKLAHGIADDMLSTIALAYTGPLIVAPAMNPTMYASAPTREALAILRRRATRIVEPTEGDVACGEQGQGKLASNAEIVAAAIEVAGRGQLLAGKKVLITSGPTQEPLDDVRYLTNRSSGKMGAAVARAALLLGAEVVVVSGPTAEPIPLGTRVHRVVTAVEMLEAAKAEAPDADLIIAAAAVADYRPVAKERGKRRRSEGKWVVELVPNPDVIAEIKGLAKQSAVVVGFAAEPGPGLETAQEKLRRKGLDAIAVNDISAPGIGFESDENELRLVFGSGEPVSSGRQSKLGCALWLLETIASRHFQGS